MGIEVSMKQMAIKKRFNLRANKEIETNQLRKKDTGKIKGKFKANTQEETRPENRPVDTKGYAQFLSVFFIISTLFGIVFFHMEIRRLGYTILTLSQDEKQVRDQLRTQTVALAKITGPERIQNVAQTRFPLKRAMPGQIIQMTQQGHAVTQ